VADVAAQLDALGIAVAKVDALAAVAVESYDHASWRDADPRQIDKMGHLLGATADAAVAAVAAVCTLAADQRPATAGDEWDALGIAVAKVDALAAVAVESYDHASWRDADPRQIDRMAHLLRVTADVAAAAVAGVGRFCILVADQQPAEAGDEWDR
jgi:kynureninase